MKDNTLDEKLYGMILDKIYSGIEGFDLEQESEKLYSSKVPEPLKKYSFPEEAYLQNLSREMQPYVEKMKAYSYEYLKNNKNQVMKSSLEDLISGDLFFPSGEFKEEFSYKLQESLEEAAYAAEIAVVEGYNVWNVKYNLPIIGKIARNQLKKKIGSDDLPNFEGVKFLINGYKSQVYDLFGNFGIEFENDFAKERAKDLYHERMKKLGYENRRLLEYDYNEGRHVPRNATESELKFKEEVSRDFSKLEQSANGISFDRHYNLRKKERREEFIHSDYNSWLEKLICYVGIFFGF